MIFTILIEGLIYSIMVLGVFCTYRVLNFCDMTVDGSFPMGACVIGVCITHGIPAAPALLIAFGAGLLAGLVTTLIYTKLKIPDLLAGIITMIILYSINLRILGNISYISFLKYDTLFSKLITFSQVHFPTASSNWGILIFLIVFVFFLKAMLDLFFHTDMGLTMGALGANPQLVISQGVNPNILRCIGICLNNGLAAVAGALFAMYSGFSDVNMGTGTVVAGLASLMLGEFIIRSNKIGLQTLRVLLGSIVYRALMILVRTYGRYIHITTNDLKLVTGILIILCLLVTKLNLKEKISNARIAKAKTLSNGGTK